MPAEEGVYSQVCIYSKVLRMNTNNISIFSVLLCASKTTPHLHPWKWLKKGKCPPEVGGNQYRRNVHWLLFLRLHHRSNLSKRVYPLDWKRGKTFLHYRCNRKNSSPIHNIRALQRGLRYFLRAWWMVLTCNLNQWCFSYLNRTISTDLACRRTFRAILG